jgi:hypothetical protein
VHFRALASIEHWASVNCSDLRTNKHKNVGKYNKLYTIAKHISFKPVKDRLVSALPRESNFFPTKQLSSEYCFNALQWLSSLIEKQ